MISFQQSVPQPEPKPQPAAAAPAAAPAKMTYAQRKQDPAFQAQVRRTRAWIFVVMVVVIGGIFAWNAMFNTAAKGDASDAYYACVDKISRELPAAHFPAPGDAKYSGVEGSWTISGSYTLPRIATTVQWTCTASRVSAGLYRVKWSPL